MKQVFVNGGQVEVRETPDQSPAEGEVLVGIVHSCITAGQTHDGVLSVFSASGVVRETGAGITDLLTGERVACVSSGETPQAELVSVPGACVVPVPHGPGYDDAAVAGFGAIALQGVRRAEPTPGECFIVAGLGLVGQLTAQLLRVNGCRVIGFDHSARRVRLAQELGMERGFVYGADIPSETIHRYTAGVGVDGIIITADVTAEILASLVRTCRARARVVLVSGASFDPGSLDLYRKECDISISVTCGPGPDKQTPEGTAVQYPISYVRWTGRRNMEEFLALAADGSVKIGPLIGGMYPVDRAADAWGAKNVPDAPPAVLLTYPENETQTLRAHKVKDPPVRKMQTGPVRVAVAGAGSFARDALLPAIVKHASLYTLRAVQSGTPENAGKTACDYGAEYSTTDFRRIIGDDAIDAVFIMNPHHLHAGMIFEALTAGKHVFAGNPLATTNGELESIKSFFRDAGDRETPLLMTGLNRRFSPVISRIRELTVNRGNPMILTYHMNAGTILLNNQKPPDEGGGLSIGDTCPVYDLFTFLTDAEVQSVEAVSVGASSVPEKRRDKFAATVSFADGSIATLTCTARGFSGYPKEKLEVYCEGMVLIMDSYAALTVYGNRNAGISGPVNEGYVEEVAAFAGALLCGGPWPVPLWQQCQAPDIAFEVERLLGG